MSRIRKHSRLLVVAICCLAVGGAASAIAGAGAAPTKTSHSATGTSAQRVARRKDRRGLRRLALRAVHVDAVVHTKTGFATVTLDRGQVQSVSGQQLTITEGTPKATYKTVTLTIPASARVRDDHQKATLSAVKPGQRVIVIQAPKRTLVLAHDPRGSAGG